MQKNKNQHSSKLNPDKESSNNFLKYSGIAFEIAGFNLVVIFGGYKLDDWFDNKIPWFIILSVLLSIIGTIYYLMQKLK